MITNVFNHVNTWMHRNARELELSQWKYYFEQGDKTAVLTALKDYQNTDGGFGHALEADNWNPESSPITTWTALKILDKIEFYDLDHPIYQGIITYLKSEKDLCSYGWRFSIPSNDLYAHAPWWHYNEEVNKEASYGVTAAFSSFILETFDENSALYQKALNFSKHLLDLLMNDGEFSDLGLESFSKLIKTVCEKKLTTYCSNELWARMIFKVNQKIEHDMTKWTNYVPRPSIFISSRNSIFYEVNKVSTNNEVKFLLDTLPDDDVWPITWCWFDNQSKYEKQFTLSENWWKAEKAIENMRFLRSFDAV